MLDGIIQHSTATNPTDNGSGQMLFINHQHQSAECKDKTQHRPNAKGDSGQSTEGQRSAKVERHRSALD